MVGMAYCMLECIILHIVTIRLSTQGPVQGCHYSTGHGTAWHIPEQFNTSFSGTEQLFNISLHVNSSCLGLWSDIYSY